MLKYVEIHNKHLLQWESEYSGDPKSGRVRISNGRPCPDFKWRSDFKWSAILVRFSNGPDHSKSELWLAQVVSFSIQRIGVIFETVYAIPFENRTFCLDFKWLISLDRFICVLFLVIFTYFKSSIITRDSTMSEMTAVRN